MKWGFAFIDVLATFSDDPLVVNIAIRIVCPLPRFHGDLPGKGGEIADFPAAQKLGNSDRELCKVWCAINTAIIRAPGMIGL